MKRLLLTLLVWVCICNISLAQNETNTNNDNNATALNRAEALKIAYITKELNLSAEEAQRFWPVYNTYISEIKNAIKESNGDPLVLEEKILNIRKHYKEELMKVLNSEKRVNTFFIAEHNFNNFIRKEWQNRMQRQRSAAHPEGARPAPFRH